MRSNGPGWPAVKFELRQMRRGAIVAAIVVIGMQAMLAGMAHLYLDNAEMERLLGSMPQGMLEGFGIHPESMTTFEGWTSGEPFTFFLLLLGFFAMNWAVGSISRERDRQTAEFLFTLPLSRSSIYWSKWCAHTGLATFIAAASAGIVLLLGSATGVLEHADAVLRLTAAGWLVVLAFMGIGYAITPWLGSERSALSVGIGIVLLSFLFNMLSGFHDSLAWLADISLFRLFDAFRISQGDGLGVASVAAAIGLFVAGSAAGWVALR